MTKPSISIQLWTVRSELENDPDGTLARLSEIGFTKVEAFGFVDRADALASAFARHGLTSPTGHASLASDVENPFAALDAPTHDQVFAAAAKLGMTTVIDPFVSPDRWQSVEEITRTANLLNAAAVTAAEHGITVGYHNHNHELLSMIDGRHALEVFAELLSPEVVLEVDLYWAAAGGADVTALVERLGARVFALHIKDGTLVPLPSLGAVPTDQVPAGTGAVPLSDALEAAPSAQYAIVEFDAYPGDIWEGVTVGFEFLESKGARR
ncbi:MAG: sugar phosphate isomerase/epimerase [Actinomycetota bacterium]|nr:sugar phosphate isomerase/epimerase [Actinomycetota bacterium]